MDVKFYWQKPIEGYIVDFYASQARIAQAVKERL
ncbi:MAG: DUF559 domain-containing protein [Candidatus Omnitrophota bacterium]|nr:DUF559 domain-containing protein [Candidatus Omnitrophota bacterium]